MGLELVEPKSEQANKDIVILANSIRQSVWIGINDKSKEGHFVYASDGTKSLKFTNWIPGQPSNWKGKEDCAHLWKQYGFRWNDAPCSSKMSFICERQSSKYDLPIPTHTCI